MEKTTGMDWTALIRQAITSGMSVSEWYKEHGISKYSFYYHCRRLGYIANGKRTEKWDEAIFGSPASDLSDGDLQVLVPVPHHLIRAAAMCDEDQGSSEGKKIRIQCGPWSIYVEDGFSPDTLRSVMEVAACAQRP